VVQKRQAQRPFRRGKRVLQGEVLFGQQIHRHPTPLLEEGAGKAAADN
jgi:hypothetical protein